MDIPIPAVEGEVVEVGSSAEPAREVGDPERKPETFSGEGETAAEDPPLEPGPGTEDGVGDEGPSVPDPDPWIRLQGSTSRISEDGRAAVKRHAISHRWGWPAAEDWPTDRLEALAEVAREWERRDGPPGSRDGARSSRAPPIGDRRRDRDRGSDLRDRRRADAPSAEELRLAIENLRALWEVEDDRRREAQAIYDVLETLEEADRILVAMGAEIDQIEAALEVPWRSSSRSSTPTPGGTRSRSPGSVPGVSCRRRMLTRSEPY